MKTKREIRFVVTGGEIELLKRVDLHFLKEFSNKRLAKRYEFTYSYEALEWLMHTIGANILFCTSKKYKAQLERLFKRIDLLLRLSDSFSVKNSFENKRQAPRLSPKLERP